VARIHSAAVGAYSVQQRPASHQRIEDPLSLILLNILHLRSQLSDRQRDLVEPLFDGTGSVIAIDARFDLQA
jgi:hypothetical protein